MTKPLTVVSILFSFYILLVSLDSLFFFDNILRKTCHANETKFAADIVRKLSQDKVAIDSFILTHVTCLVNI